VELRRAQRRPRQAGLGHHSLGFQLRSQVAEHRTVDAAHDRDAIGADDRDIDEVRRACARRGADQVPRLLLVTLGRACEVQDHVRSLDGRFDALARREVAGHELDALLGRAAPPAQDA
jgi:hypothetical protein